MPDQSEKPQVNQVGRKSNPVDAMVLNTNAAWMTPLPASVVQDLRTVVDKHTQGDWGKVSDATWQYAKGSFEHASGQLVGDKVRESHGQKIMDEARIGSAWDKLKEMGSKVFSGLKENTTTALLSPNARQKQQMESMQKGTEPLWSHWDGDKPLKENLKAVGHTLEKNADYIQHNMHSIMSVATNKTIADAASVLKDFHREHEQTNKREAENHPLVRKLREEKAKERAKNAGHGIE